MRLIASENSDKDSRWIKMYDIQYLNTLTEQSELILQKSPLIHVHIITSIYTVSLRGRLRTH